MKTSGSSYLKYRTWTLTAAKNLFPGSCAAVQHGQGRVERGQRAGPGRRPDLHRPDRVTLANPGNQTGTVGTAASLQLSATGGGHAVTFGHRPPAGLSINASTGVICGTPTTVGTSSVTATVTDNAGPTTPPPASPSAGRSGVFAAALVRSCLLTREPLGQTRPPWPNENLPLFEWRAVVARHGSTAPSRRFDSRQEHRRIVHARLATDTTENRRRLKSTIATSPSNGHSLPSAPRVASAGLRGTRPSPRLPTLAPLTIAWRDGQ